MSQQTDNDETLCAKKTGGFSGDLPDSLACVFVSDGCSSSQRKFVKGGLKYFNYSSLLCMVNKQTFIFWPGKVL